MKKTILSIFVIMIFVTACGSKSQRIFFLGTYSTNREGAIYDYFSICEYEYIYFYRSEDLSGYQGSFRYLDEDLLLLENGPFHGYLVLYDDEDQIRLIDTIDTKSVTIYHKRQNICLDPVGESCIK